MKLCTRMRIIDTDGDYITDVDVLDISLVDDDHEVGINELTGELHVPGKMVDTGEPDRLR